MDLIDVVLKTRLPWMYLVLLYELIINSDSQLMIDIVDVIYHEQCVTSEQMVLNQ
jgi:hypothetical protein